MIFWVPPTSSLLLYYLLYLPCLGCAIAPSTSRFPSPKDAGFSLHFHLPLFFPFYFTLLQLLFYNPHHPCPSLTPSLPAPCPHPPLPESGVQAAPEWQGDIVCHISIPRQSPFSPESNYFFQSERFNLL